MPYRSKDSLSPRAEFSHPNVVSALILLTYDPFNTICIPLHFDDPNTYAHIFASKAASMVHDLLVCLGKLKETTAIGARPGYGLPRRV